MDNTKIRQCTEQSVFNEEQFNRLLYYASALRNNYFIILSKSITLSF